MKINHTNSHLCDYQRGFYLTWLRIAWFMRKTFGIKAYGIGWIASRAGCAFDFTFQDVPFRFLPSAARSYCLLPAGIPNEPETHEFLRTVLADREDVLFIDIGASIGEFAIPMAHDPRVSKVLAFEPQPQTCQALQASAFLAPEGKITIIQKGVASEPGTARFDWSVNAPTAAGLYTSGNRRGQDSGGGDIELCTLDEAVIGMPALAAVMLIDIEGGELDALRGGMDFIARYHPLIVFEYNTTTRQFFKLSEAAELLGPSYRIYRLRSADGRLDTDLSVTWNVVALPASGPWQNLSELEGLFAS